MNCVTFEMAVLLAEANIRDRMDENEEWLT